MIMMGHGLELTYGPKYGLRGMQDRLKNCWEWVLKGAHWKVRGTASEMLASKIYGGG